MTLPGNGFDVQQSFSDASRCVDDALRLIEAMAGLPYGGEPVDQRSHALQSAHHAIAAAASDELVAAAVLHDIARAPAVAHHHQGPHAPAGADWCRRRFGSPVATLVGAHVEAKRWLIATDEPYRGSLSAASQDSLARQGGPMSPDQAASFVIHPWAVDAIALRRWDDAAKIPGGPEADILALRPVLLRLAQLAARSE